MMGVARLAGFALVDGGSDESRGFSMMFGDVVSEASTEGR
jgi:hypothetical protein